MVPHFRMATEQNVLISEIFIIAKNVQRRTINVTAEERIIFDDAKAALAAEQREHDITRHQRDVLQTQCEDMQGEMETERRMNNAALKPSQNVAAEDAACKAAEAKVIEQRKEIEALKCGDDLWMCPSADYCDDECGHHTAHPHNERCEYECRDAIGHCVKVNTCKECAKMREEIINRDAVILEQERRAEDREEIIKALAKEIKLLRYPDTEIKPSDIDTRIAKDMMPVVNKFIVMFSGKAGDMQTPKTKHQCKWYNVCAIASETSHACIANEGQHCGRKRDMDAKHG